MSDLAHTHKTERFAAKVISDQRTGVRKLRLSSERYFRHILNTKLREGEEVTLSVTSWKPKRTEQQNRYYWGVYLPLIAKETGETDLDKLHELFKGMFLTETIAEVLGKKVRITKSTSSLSVSDFCMYILSIEQFTGVQAPPTENHNLAPLTAYGKAALGITDSQDAL